MGAKKIHLIINTLKYLTKKQIFYRFRYIIEKKFSHNINLIKSCDMIGIKYSFFALDKAAYYYKDSFKSTIDLADQILANRFTFLNTLSFEFDDKIIWKQDPFNYRLWNFNLNYFDYLYKLIDAFAFTNERKYLEQGIELIESWNEANVKQYHPDIWDAYVISKRLINWINFLGFYQGLLPLINEADINNSIATHAHFLSKHVEYHLDANHVIMDGKGLLFSGIYLKDHKLLQQGINILTEEYQRQIANNGEHYERSPSYQIEVLSHYAESYIVLLKNGFREEAENIKPYIYKMASYLNKIMMPNGEIPLLNDSSLDYPFEANDILQLCSLITNHQFCTDSKELSPYVVRLLGKEAINLLDNRLKEDNYKIVNEVPEKEGYFVIKDIINEESLYFLFDGGNNGPDNNLGHAHADSLNVILTIGSQKILVDSGTFTYKKDTKRDHYRSTRSHNTICIDGINSSEVWGAFRVAKRAKTKVLKYVEADDYTYISAFHNGYQKVLLEDAIIHQREIIYVKGKALFIIDTLKGNIRHHHMAGMYYYFDGSLKIAGDVIQTANNQLKLCVTRPYTIEPTFVSELFSVEKQAKKLNCTWDFQDSCTTVTKLIFNGSSLDIMVKDDLFIATDDMNVEILRGSRWMA